MKLYELENIVKRQVKGFIQDVYSTGTPNPLGRGVVFGVSDKEVSAMVKVEMSFFDGMAHISELIVLEGNTRKGFGGHIMEMINKKADKWEVTLHLAAVPIEVMGVKIPQGKVMSFYKSHGFVAQDGQTMIREPKAK